MPDAAFSHLPFLRDFLFVRSQWDLNPNPLSSRDSVLSTYTRLLISATPILLMYGQRWISLYVVACSMKLYTHYSILMVGTVRFELMTSSTQRKCAIKLRYVKKCSINICFYLEFFNNEQIFYSILIFYLLTDISLKYSSLFLNIFFIQSSRIIWKSSFSLTSFSDFIVR